eukprot:GHVP01066184.1.p1 GENE.GHVP01066184.1~~GHVP01066184.1.p1  ORF type:complete len:268 (+),score=36.53 GHVP01066184.1:53-856(+)
MGGWFSSQQIQEFSVSNQREGNLRSGAAPVSHRYQDSAIESDVRQIRPMTINCSLNRKSFGISGQANAVKVCFKFECKHKSSLRLVWKAKEEINSEGEFLGLKQRSGGRIDNIGSFEVGQHDFKSDSPFNLEEADAFDKNSSHGQFYYPLVVELKPDNNSDVRLLTYFAFRNQQKDLQPLFLKQNVIVGKEIFNLYDIFGFESTEAPIDFNRDCLVCLSEKRDTVVLPCGHMCLCESCAQSMRLMKHKTCPICRQKIVSFLRLESGS